MSRSIGALRTEEDIELKSGEQGIGGEVAAIWAGGGHAGSALLKALDADLGVHRIEAATRPAAEGGDIACGAGRS